MTIEIELGTKTAILLAIECFIEHSKYVMKEKEYTFDSTSANKNCGDYLVEKK